MGRPGLLAKARSTKASSIEARQHSGADTIVECTHALQGTRMEGGNSKKQENIVSCPRHHRCCCFKEATSRRCSRGGPNTNKAPFGVNKSAHIRKLEYQGYNFAAVPLDLVLGVVSTGHGQATTAPGETVAAVTLAVTRGDPPSRVGGSR